MKRTLLILVLILTMTASYALAAPARERSEPFGLEEAELMAVQPLVNAAAYAAFQKSITRLPHDRQPEQALVEGVLMRAIQEHLFPVEFQGQTLALTDAQAQDMVSRLFTWQDIPAISTPEGPGFSKIEGGLQIDLSQQPDYVGVHVYEAGHDNAGALIVKGDVYRLSGIEGMAQDVPEDSLVWLGHIDLSLARAQNAPAGYTLSGFAVDELYQAQGYHQFFDEENGYELSYPDIFPQREEPLKKGEPLVLGTDDGQATLTVSFVPGSLSELEAAWKAEMTENANARMTERGTLVLQSPREMRLAVPDEGNNQCLVLILFKPEDRPCEYGLYWEFLENSFVVYAHAAG